MISQFTQSDIASAKATPSRRTSRLGQRRRKWKRFGKRRTTHLLAALPTHLLDQKLGQFEDLIFVYPVRFPIERNRLQETTESDMELILPRNSAAITT